MPLKNTNTHTHQISGDIHTYSHTHSNAKTHTHTSLRCRHGVAVISSAGLTSLSPPSPISCHYVPLFTSQYVITAGRTHPQGMRSSLFDRGDACISAIRVHLIMNETSCSLITLLCSWWTVVSICAFKSVCCQEQNLICCCGCLT